MMDRIESPLLILAICLAALAGFVDGIAFLSLGGFFASFMSGNSTRLGVGLGSGDAQAATMAGAAILAFLSGVILSGVVARRAGAAQRVMVMALVTALLLAATVHAMVAPGPFTLILLAMAMGAENAVLKRDGAVTIGLTYMTGSLVRLGDKLSGALMGDADRWGWIPYLTLWIGFVSGAVSGVAAEGRWGWNALWLATAVSLLITMVTARMRRQAPAAGA